MHKTPFYKRAFQLIDEWSLTSYEQRQLFGIQTTDRVKLERMFRRKPRHDLSRIVMLLEIQDFIKMLFPGSQCKQFIRSKTNYFDGRCPMQIIMTQREHGLDLVHTRLSCDVRVRGLCKRGGKL